MRTLEVGESVTVYFDVFLTDGGPALSETGNQPQTLLNAGSFSNNGIGVLSSQGYGRYSATLDGSLLSLAVGDIIRTRYKGTVTAESFGDTFVVVDSSDVVPDDALSISYYGALASADLFFSQRLNVRKWTNSPNADKIKALTMATQIIDRLNFSGYKANSGQVLQFPRKNTYTDPITLIPAESADTNVPNDIKIATYLIAYKLLDGYDPDIQANMLSTEMSKYQSTQTYYDRSVVQDFMQAGIPSSEAWNYLRPYLRDPREVELSRV